MIKCPKCGADNLLGAIFCRSCGSKLNLEDLKPDDIAEKKSAFSVQTVGKSLFKLVKLVVLVVLISGLVGILLAPSGFQPNRGLDAKEFRAAMDKVTGLTRAPSRAAKVVFTADEIAVLADALLGFSVPDGVRQTVTLAEPPEAVITSVDVDTTLIDGAFLRVVLKQKLLGKVSVYTTVVGALQVDEKGLVFHVIKARVGRVPLPGGGREFAVRRIRGLCEAKVQKLFEALAPHVKAIEGTSEELTLSVAP